MKDLEQPPSSSAQEDKACRSEKDSTAKRSPTTMTGLLNSTGQESQTGHKRISGANFNNTKMELQRAYGNRYISKIAGQARDDYTSLPLQTKVSVSTPGDPFEQEADKLADIVMMSIAKQPSLGIAVDNSQKQIPIHAELRNSLLCSRGITQTEDSLSVPPEVNRIIKNARGKGRPLPKITRQKMENGFGADFASVRIHTGIEVDQITEALHAEAMTSAEDIFIREAAFAPNTRAGQRLLAHELAHVLQQRNSITANSFSSNEFFQKCESSDNTGGKTSKKRTAEVHNDEESLPAQKRTNSNISPLRSEFWVRAILTPTENSQKVNIDTLKIENVDIANKRRPTRQAPNQGDHLVAWEAMLRYWERVLNGKDCKSALDILQGWIIEDLFHEVKSQSISDPEAEFQDCKISLRLIQDLRTNEATLDTILKKFETVISLFIRSNQKSTFATVGKASGGKGEASALATLEAFEREISQGSYVDNRMAQESALKLLDIEKASSNLTKAKAVTAWYRMLKELFPKLNAAGVFLGGDSQNGDPKKLQDQRKFYRYEVSNLEKRWSDHVLNSEKEYFSGAERTLDWKKLVPNDEPTAMDLEDPKIDQMLQPIRAPVDFDMLGEENQGDISNDDTLVRVTIKPNSDALQLTKYAQDKIDLKTIEVPDIRAPTRFFPYQGAHTLAWTYKRKTLIAMLNNKNLKDATEKIEKLAAHDKSTINLGHELHYNYEIIDSYIKEGKCELRSVMNWNIWIRTLIAAYIEANQLLPTTTYSGAYTPTGHGEGTTNQSFEKLNPQIRTEYDKLVNSVSRFIDIGIIYKPLLDSVRKYDDLKCYGDPLKDGKPLNIIKQNKSNASTLSSISQNDLAKRFLLLCNSSRFSYSSAGDLSREIGSDSFRALFRMIKESRRILGILQCKLNFDTPSYIPTESQEFFVGDLQIQLDSTETIRAVSNYIYQKIFGNSLTPVAPKKDFKNLIKRFDTSLIVQFTNFIKNDEQTRIQGIESLNELAETLKSRTYFSSYVLAGERSSLPAAKKILGDFWSHLPFYDKYFFDVLKDDTEKKKKILEAAFLAPLAETDMMIGAALKIHLAVNYDEFIRNLRRNIKDAVEKTGKEDESIMVRDFFS